MPVFAPGPTLAVSPAATRGYAAAFNGRRVLQPHPYKPYCSHRILPAATRP